jgi:hypothetical protein
MLVEEWGFGAVLFGQSNTKADRLQVLCLQAIRSRMQGRWPSKSLSLGGSARLGNLVHCPPHSPLFGL